MNSRQNAVSGGYRQVKDPFPKPLDDIDAPQFRLSRRGENNRLRKGQSKIHRRYIPALCSAVPRGMASRVVARMGSHDWCRNPDLVELRRQGYTPYTKRKDPTYQPKPMRIHARSESREALTALSLALAANCDYNPDNDYPFEIMAPFEHIAQAMGMLHVYENGRKSYDPPRHALSVMEQLGYVIVLHGKDSESGQNKPLRVWLSEQFFTSRGITVDEIRQWLGQFKRWAVEKGLTETLRRKYERHLLRIERIGIDLADRHSLRNRLRQIKRWVVSPDLAKRKQAKVSELEQALDNVDAQERGQNAQRLDLFLDESLQKVSRLGKRRQPRQEAYYQAFVKWSTSAKVPRYEVIKLEQELKQQYPALLNSDPEAYYRLLLTRAGVLNV
ncbi:Replication protein [Candidatus Symbiopectobacterium sp. 'North America']|uniref:Replication protein n=1 Tax=Candidatus Symbiopectobacterium sp. 'North America' TaxID=2794574 RepID=UPI0027DBE8A1|nr:Replication protein [Candidatus Symbiopectobacterium sp. 'North America']